MSTLNPFLRAVEARIIREREEQMASTKASSARFASERFAESELRGLTRRHRRLAREAEITRRAREIRAVTPMSGNAARAAAREAMAREGREEAECAALERMKTARRVVELVRQGRTMREIAERLGLDDEKHAYGEWRWATRRQSKL